MGKFPPYANYEMILVKIWKQTSDATIIQHNLFHGILQKYFGKYLVWKKTEHYILKAKLKNWPRLEKNFMYNISLI